MSFILDALRKSEARRKKGEVPGLDSDSGPTVTRRRRRFPAWMLLAAPLCLVVVAGGVFLLRPEWLPQTLVGGGTADPSPVPETTVVAEPAEDERGEGAVDERELAHIEPIEDVPVEMAADDDAVEEVDEQDATATVDRRRMAQPATGQTVTRAAPEREQVVTDHDEAMAEIERRVAETRQRQEEAEATRRIPEQPVADREREQRRRIADSPAHADDAPAEMAVQPEWRTQTAEYVRAWELPLSVRRNLPELKLSIHVFSAEEDGRFVLINGERYVPGDQLSGGARLVDIRREGAIVDFREHRFLLEP